jgi:nucleotide-binding universal stress UspA family protein
MAILAYLYAAFRFETYVSEGLTEEQLEAVIRWNDNDAIVYLGWPKSGETTRKRGSVSARILDTV